MTARILKSTPERVDACISRLRAEGRKIGWHDGAVRGTSEVRACVGGEQKRVRALIILAAVDRGDKVPFEEVVKARRDLKMPELPPGRRGPLPKGADAAMLQALPGDGTSLLERLVRGVERMAAAMERMEDRLSGVSPASVSTTAPAPTRDEGAASQSATAVPITQPPAGADLPRPSTPSPPATRPEPAPPEQSAATRASTVAPPDQFPPPDGSVETATPPPRPPLPAAQTFGSLPPRPMPKPRKPSD